MKALAANAAFALLLGAGCGLVLLTVLVVEGPATAWRASRGLYDAMREVARV